MTTTIVPSTAGATNLFCYNHPQTETLLRCKQCDLPICLQCRTDVEVGSLCSDCFNARANVYHPMDGDGRVNPYHIPQKRPRVTYWLAALISLVWLLVAIEYAFKEFSTIWVMGVSFGPFIAGGQWWRFVTSLFLHNGVEHLMFNAIALLAFGPEMEGLYGRRRFLLIYLLAGIYGGLLSFGIYGFEENSVGASGAIFGVVGMNLAFFTLYRHQMGEYGAKQRRQVLTIFGITFVYGLIVGNINHAAHIGGLIAGAALGYLLAPRYWMPAQEDDSPLTDSASLARRWWVVVVALLVFGVGARLVQQSLLLAG